MAADYDVIIVGGGMVGATLAVALAGTGSRIAIVEAVPPGSIQQPSYDDRGLALSLSSRRVLQALGLWDQVAVTANPVRHIHISDQHHFGFVRLHAKDLNLAALGYVVLARELGQVLSGRVRDAGTVDLICPAQINSVAVGNNHVTAELPGNKHRPELTGKLLVAADGSQSRICELLGIGSVVKNYGQTAIVTNVTAGKPHVDTAYERFTGHGPLALLPLPEHRFAVVFTVKTEDADRYMNMPEPEFLGHIQAGFGYRPGALWKPGTRKSYPLRLITAMEQVRDRVVVLGNAAHTIHPNAAQGLNLCLRDIAGLVEILVPVLRAGEDPGRVQLLNRYRRLRARDQADVIRFTDGLVSMFCNDLPHRIMLRNLGMLLIDLCPLLKRKFIRRATGISGRQPALVRGVPL